MQIIVDHTPFANIAVETADLVSEGASIDKHACHKRNSHTQTIVYYYGHVYVEAQDSQTCLTSNSS